jgi:hypothetical protein
MSGSVVTWSHRAAALGLVAGLAGSGGCSAQCSGPGCSTSYGTARLSWIPTLAAGAELDAWQDATGAWTGNEAQGTDWRVATALGRALLGQRDADQVVATSVRASRGALNPLSSWTGTPGSDFGHDLAALPSDVGFDLWVSAPGEDFGKGRVHLFRGTDLQERTHDLVDAAVSVGGATPNDQLGSALATCGDLTGDGLAEVLVGAPMFGQPDRAVPWIDVIPPLAGALFLVRSGTVDNRVGTFLPWEVGTTWFAPTSGAGLGTAQACDRDLDGDKAVDVLAGAPYADDGAGRMYVLDGAALPADGSLSGVPYLVGEAPGDWFGASVLTFVLAGSPHVLVGAPGADGGAGRVYLFRGADVTQASTSRTGALSVTPRSVFRSPSGGTGQHFGRTLAVGDLDGDGRDDLVVGTPDAQGPGGNDFDTGAVDVWFGRRTWAEVEELPDARVVGTDPFQRIGRSMLAHDFDGDAVDDLLLPTRARARSP